jgi:hypothetical protein
MDWDEVSSSDTDEEALLSPPSGDDWPQPSTAAAAGGPASSSQGGAVFEPFEVEEEQHATELKYLRGAYAKKVRVWAWVGKAWRGVGAVSVLCCVRAVGA